jgi:hypothetical protein
LDQLNQLGASPVWKRRPEARSDAGSNSFYRRWCYSKGVPDQLQEGRSTFCNRRVDEYDALARILEFISKLPKQRCLAGARLA